MTVLTAAPDVFDLVVVAGADFEVTLDLTDEDGVALSLDSSAFTATIGTDPKVTTAIATFTAVGITGGVTLTLTDTQTAALGRRPLWWRLNADDAGFKSTPAAGKVTVMLQ